MNEIIIKMFLDVSVAAMLCITIYYCIKLNKKVQLLQDSKSDLAQLITQFDESMQQATVSINDIHRASKKINENIQGKLDKANYLADDLAFMIERANKSADRIEKHVTPGRIAASNDTGVAPHDGIKQHMPTPANEPANPKQRLKETTARLRDRTKADVDATRKASQRSNAAEPEGKKGIEAMMERIGEMRDNAPAASVASRNSSRARNRSRSKSEQDLMEALKRESSKG